MNYATCYITTLIRVHVKINPKANASVLNMNCYCVTVVDCLKVTHSTRQLQLIFQIVHVFAHFRALTVNLQKILYNSKASCRW